MRSDPNGSLLTQRIRDPRVVVGIIFPTASIYLTNRTGIANVPGVPVHGVLTDLSATSQTIRPEHARATIGTLSFTAVDLAGALTDELRDQLLVELRGVRGREVRVYTGDTDDFTDVTWQRVETYVVDGCVLRGRSYAFTCSDRNREQRVDIFDQAKTRLSATLSASATSVSVVSTSGFNMLAHTAAFTDAPSSTVGYIRVVQTGEIIRYTGTSGGNTFTGCTRGVFNTVPQEVVVDGSLAVDRRPEIEEFIYLEGPAPWIDYAVKTGVMLGTANTLPATWHMGIDPSNVSQTQYEAVGTDLYDPSDVTGGLQLRFTYLQKTDGKRFSEEQLHLPMLTFGPIDANGVIGLRRIVPIVSQAAPVALLSPNTVISHAEIRHSLNSVVNRVVINWNYDGEDYTRRDVFIHTGSVAKHGQGRVLEYSLRGLTVQRDTPATLQRIVETLFERFAAPPIEVDLKLSRSQNALEVGDAALVALPNVRDFTAASSLLRTFEIQSRRIDWLTGQLNAQVFASTERAVLDAPSGSGAILSDAWYSSEGVALNTVLTMSGNNVTANGNLAGNADLRSGIYYHLGDLVINAGVTVTVNQNVQLRVRGSVTINGAIDGVGRGISGTASPDVVSTTWQDPPSTTHAAFFGATRSSDAISALPFGIGPSYVWFNVPGNSYTGRNAAVPRLALTVESGVLIGVPADLRGCPGVYGPPCVNLSSRAVLAKGGDGGDGGAGLMIVSRGTIGFGVSGQIDLSGGDGSAAPATGSLGGVTFYGGGGAGGAPGALYSLLDGNSVTIPDFSTALIVDQGLTPITGTPAVQGNGSFLTFPAQPATGINPGLSGQDHWDAAKLVQYVPADIAAGASQDEAVPAPTSLAVTGSDIGAQISWTSPPADRHDFVEVWRSTTNDRTGAVRIFRGRADAFFDGSPTVVTRYFWIRAGKDRLGFSAWHPVGSTSGVAATYGGAIGLAPWTPILVNVTRNGSTFTKTGGAASTWDSSFYSQEGYHACAISFRASQTNMAVMVGLDANPSASHTEAAIDYAIYCAADGNAYFWENGGATQGALGGSYSTSDQFTLTYDGLRVRYYKNGSLLRTVALIGARLFADSTFFDSFAAVNSVSFGPITHVLANAVGWAADSQGKPAGVRAIAGIADRSALAILGGKLGITGAAGSTIRYYGLPAIPVNQALTYQITVNYHAFGTSGGSHVYLSLFEHDGASLAAGKTHVGDVGTGEAAILEAYQSTQDLIAGGTLQTTQLELTFEYQPTSGTLFASLAFGLADAAGITLTVNWVAMTVLGSNVDLLPGVVPPLDTFGLNPEAATEVYTIEEFGSESGSGSWEDELSITIAQDSIVMIEARANSVGAGSTTDQGVWVPYVGGTDGPPSYANGGSGLGAGNPFVHAFATFVVAAGTYNIGMRAEDPGLGSYFVNDRFITITVIKR